MRYFAILLLVPFFIQCSQSKVEAELVTQEKGIIQNDSIKDFKNLSEKIWREILTPEEFNILRKKVLKEHLP